MSVDLPLDDPEESPLGLSTDPIASSLPAATGRLPAGLPAFRPSPGLPSDVEDEHKRAAVAMQADPLIVFRDR